uniref:Putative secreted protein n=1 Tax=Panstrongylus lignarius TaxID=156445 RepID=A0A224Y4A4_9HEMI
MKNGLCLRQKQIPLIYLIVILIHVCNARADREVYLCLNGGLPTSLLISATCVRRTKNRIPLYHQLHKNIFYVQTPLDHTGHQVHHL